jgi:hypothetical protein
MSRRQFLVTAVACMHLVLVACGATGLFQALAPAAPVRAVQWYGTMSGASTGYGFFAPGVGPQIRAAFVLTDAQGRCWKDDFEAGRNQEVRLRLGSLVDAFPLEEAEEALRHDVLASWADTQLARHPQAHKVEIRVEAFEVPSRAEFRAGARPGWVTLYRASFIRDQFAAAKGRMP